MSVFFFVKQKTAYEMRISDWSSDVCSSDLRFDLAPRARYPAGLSAVRTTSRYPCMSGHILPYRGLWPKIHPDAFIADTATVIGDVEIGPGSSIWFGCILRGDVNRIRVGAGSNLQDGTVVHGNHDRAGDYRETGGGMPTVIGDNVVVGHQAMPHENGRAHV